MKECKEICADPDLFINKSLTEKSIKFINNCPLKNKYICKWSKKELDSWGI